MGLISNLVLLPLAPVRGVLWLAETLQAVAEEQLDDPQRWHEALREAQAANQRGELSDDDLAEVEQYVLDRLVPVTDYDEVPPL